MSIRFVQLAGKTENNLLDSRIRLTAYAGILGFLVLGLVAISKQPFESGGDEGFHLMRALLVTKGFSLYDQIWSDQPPIFTALLAAVFEITGPSATAARCVVLLMACLLLLAHFEIGFSLIGGFASLFGVASLAISAHFVDLALCAMLPLPAMSLGLLGVLAWFEFRHSGSKWCLASSGILMGFAIQTKLSALILLPALAFQALVSAKHKCGGQSPKKAVEKCAIWFGAICATLGVILIMYPGVSWDAIWQSHSDASFSGVFAPPLRLWEMLRQHGDVSLFAVAAATRIFVRRHWQCGFFLILLASALSVHSVQRPFYSYYYLHIALPLCWLFGYAVNEAITMARSLRIGASNRVATSEYLVVIVLAGLLGIYLARLPERLHCVAASFTPRESRVERHIVSLLAERRARTTWVYTDSPIFAFHARLLVPPELAVVSPKRIRTGRITVDKLILWLEKYRPEQIVLRSHKLGGHALTALLDRNYRLIFEENSIRYYVANELFETDE